MQKQRPRYAFSILFPNRKPQIIHADSNNHAHSLRAELKNRPEYLGHTSISPIIKIDSTRQFPVTFANIKLKLRGVKHGR